LPTAWCLVWRADARYAPDVKLAIDLSAAEAELLQERARALGIDPQELARAAVADVLSAPPDDFRALAEALLERNAELYRRWTDLTLDDLR
jgi:hypothetical protein